MGVKAEETPRGCQGNPHSHSWNTHYFCRTLLSNPNKGWGQEKEYQSLPWRERKKGNQINRYNDTKQDTLSLSNNDYDENDIPRTTISTYCPSTKIILTVDSD